MRKALTVAAVCLSFTCGVVVAQVHDWHDLDRVQKHIIEAENELSSAAAANHYDMNGHAGQAEQHLKMAEREVGLAIEAAQRR